MNATAHQKPAAPGRETAINSPEALYHAWTAAMESLDVERVLACYEAETATFWGTLADVLKTGHEEIQTYFDLFLDRCSLEIQTMELRVRTAAPGIALASGAYEFTLGGATPSDPTQSVEARFSFVFRQQGEGGTWRITDHHSSAFPANPLEAPNS